MLVLGRCTSITIVILHHDVLRGEAIHPAHDAAYGGEEVMYPLLEPGSGVVGEYGV